MNTNQTISAIIEVGGGVLCCVLIAAIVWFYPASAQSEIDTLDQSQPSVEVLDASPSPTGDSASRANVRMDKTS